MTTQTRDDRAERLRQAIRLKKAAARTRPPSLPRRPEEEPAMLGELQRGLWLEHRLRPASPAYNLVSAFRVPLASGGTRLERALARLVARHRLLRSTFRPHRDGVVQVIRDPEPVAVERFTAAPGEALAVATREARVPFDLETGPLLRMLLVTEGDGDEPLLVLLLHHVLADERSLGILWRELAALYDDRDPGDPEPPQYDDYVHWAARRDPRERQTDLDFWKVRLDPLPEDLELAVERPEEPTGSTRGRWLSRPLGPAARQRIQDAASATGTTPFVVLAFAYRLLLHRTASGRDVAFATPVSQRSHPATAGMIGYFLNPVVIRAAVDERRSVERAIGDFHRHLREALDHASLPFDALVEALAPDRQQGRHPLFQTLFVYQETPPPPELGGVRLKPVTLDLGESKLDLSLFATDGGSERDSGLEIAVEYRADRFDEASMRRLLGHYETLISQLVEDLARPVHEVAMLRPDEAGQLRAFARGAPLDASTTPDGFLPQQILAASRRRAADPAVIGRGETWRYAELELAARRIARELTRRGVSRGDRVALYLDRSPRMIAGLLGCHLAGAAYVPLDPAYPSDRNLDVLADAGVAAVLVEDADVLAADVLAIDVLAIDVPAVDVTRLAKEAGEAGEPALPEIQGEDPAYVLYTSGSTGRPKGVVITHANLKASNDARLQVYGTPPDLAAGSREALRFLLLPSVAFDSSVAGIFWALATGGALILPSSEEARDPRALARLVRQHRVNSLLCVPSLYARLLEAGSEGQLASLEIAIVAGESCPSRMVDEHFRRLPRARLLNEYGPTEGTVWATVHELEPSTSAPVPVGRPIPGVRVEVLDAAGRRVPAGIPGEGWIAGPTVARGYWRRPRLTAERFATADSGTRMYRTGDRLSWTDDGRLLFHGRVDEQIQLRGFRIEPGEIETALLEDPGIARATVVVREDRLVAFVELAGDVEQRSDVDRRSDLARRLPGFMMPSRIVGLRGLPRLPNGKVDRARLREMKLDAEPSPDVAAVPDDRTRSMISLFEGLLGRGDVAPTDNFFQLGGHSLLVVDMVSAIERDTGVALTPAEVFQHPTALELARRIEQRGGPATPAYAHLFPIQPGGRGDPLLFCVPHFFSRMAAERFRGERPVYGLRGVSLRPEGNRGRWPTLRHLGAELVAEIRRRFPDESYRVAGYSFGASMAVEAVRQMEEAGMTVRRLDLIAPMPVDVYRAGPFRWQIDGLRQSVTELTLRRALGRYARVNHPFARPLYRRLWRLLAIQPWRRLLCGIGALRQRAGLPLTSRILHADVRLERFRLHSGYRPGIVQTPTVIFNPREPATDAAATWRPYFAGPFTVVETPDPHLGEAEIQAAKAVILEHWRELDAT